MKSASFFVALSATILIMSGCANSEHNEPSSNQSSVKREISHVENVNQKRVEEGRSFIRTSEMKFRVTNVVAATTQIEHITKGQQGFITYSNMKSSVDKQETVQKSLDSSLERIQYTVTNEITLRIPNSKLDSTLTAIASLVDFIDYRIIKAEDVALQMKANQKAQQRSALQSKHIREAVNDKKGKIEEATDAEIMAGAQQKEADDAEISNLSLSDQVEYSTVSLSIYQRTTTQYWVLANEDDSMIKTGIGIRIWDSIKTGWYFAEDVFIGILKLWFVFAIALIGYVVYRKYFRKKTAVLAK